MPTEKSDGLAFASGALWGALLAILSLILFFATPATAAPIALDPADQATVDAHNVRLSELRRAFPNAALPSVIRYPSADMAIEAFARSESACRVVLALQREDLETGDRQVDDAMAEIYWLHGYQSNPTGRVHEVMQRCIRQHPVIQEWQYTDLPTPPAFAGVPIDRRRKW